MKTIVVISIVLLAPFLASGQIPSFRAGAEQYGITDVSTIAHFYGHGASAADYDNDGDIDFYLATNSGLKDRLYQNQGDGTFMDVALASNIDISSASRLSLWFDYNSDGLLDLLVLGERCVNFKCGQPVLFKLFRQESDHSFTDVSASSGIVFGDKYDNLDNYAVGGLASGDLNNDGLPDIVLSVWGGRLTILYNNGDGSFSDRSESTGMGLANEWYWQPLIADFNNDGWQDIFINVDFDENQLWRNKGDGTFQNIASQAGVDSDFNEMGLTAGDFDNDGDLDIYVTNISRTIQYTVLHNLFLKNDSYDDQIRFGEWGLPYGVGQSGWDWGCTFFDMNNDGWLDLATTNGWNDPSWQPDQSKLWLNSKASFSEVSSQSGFNDMLSATTLIAFDMDRDGDLDLLQSLKRNENIKSPALLYENNLDEFSNAGNYLTIKPRMHGPNVFAIGAIVRIKTKSSHQMRLITAGTSFYGQEPAEAFFGIGDATMIPEITIEWPNNTKSIYKNIAGNQVITLYDEVISPPENLEFSIQNGKPTLSWDDRSDNEVGFVLQLSSDREFESPTVVRLPAETREYNLETFLGSSFRYVRVQAFNSLVYSDYSNVVDARELILGQQESISLSIFPNPVKSNLVITLGGNQRWTKIEILDLNGKVYVNQSTESYEEKIEIDLSKIPPGVYIARVTGGIERIEQKIIKIP